jgi:hypothetical protein
MIASKAVVGPQLLVHMMQVVSQRLQADSERLAIWVEFFPSQEAAISPFRARIRGEKAASSAVHHRRTCRATPWPGGKEVASNHALSVLFHPSGRAFHSGERRANSTPGPGKEDLFYATRRCSG